MSVEALTAAQVAERVAYSPRTIRELVRAGKFPAPIDADLSVRRWRWSSVVVDAYRSGEWRAA